MAANVTIVGALQGEPELRFIASGSKVTRFTVRVSGKAKQGEERPQDYFDCVAWGELAENVAESLKAKDRVIVSGVLKQRTWEKDGQKRSKIEVTAYNVGPELSYATASVVRNERTDGNSGGGLADF